MNPLYLGYIGAFALSVWAIIVFFARSDLARLHVTDPPRRTTAVLFLLLSGLFLFLWLSILLPAMQARTPPEGATIFVFDFAIVLPALGATAVLLWRRAHWGDILALPLLIKAATLGLSVLLGTLIAPLWGQPANPGEIATYAALAVLPLGLTLPWWRALAG